jgi:formylglycine-generating enzyme required for sulfatase activity
VVTSQSNAGPIADEPSAAVDEPTALTARMCFHRAMWRWSPAVLLLAEACAPAEPPLPVVQPPPAAASTPDGAPSAPSPVGKMMRVPEATYRMGSEAGDADERPVHEVHVATFDLDATEVTVAQYSRCVHAGGCPAAPTTVQFRGVTAEDHQISDGECNDSRTDRADHPENCVDWSMADAYCRWAGKRLPTEEEWEYAACSGNCDQALGRSEAAALASAQRWPFTTRAARSRPGPFGLYDMAGNVFQWIADCWHDSYLGAPLDGGAWMDGSCAEHVIRGGSFAHLPRLLRSAYRFKDPVEHRSIPLGFRLARTLEP